MGVETKIQWADSTWNPWRGCSKVSPGCVNCYADQGSKRNTRVLGQWGTEAQGGTRVVASENGPNGWRAPELWNERREQEARNTARPIAPHFVFPSWCDPFEDWPGRMHSHTGRPLWWCGGSLTNSPVPSDGLPDDGRYASMQDVRDRLWQLIEDTPRLTWLLLTKRPENVRGMVPPAWMRDGFPRNVWLGASAENQYYAARRTLELVAVPAAVRFLSVEPQLEEINLGLIGTLPRTVTGSAYVLTCQRIQWVICGGESGPNARPFSVEWARKLRDECREAGVKFFMKQLGSNAVGEDADAVNSSAPTRFALGTILTADRKAGDPAEWPEDLHVREMPEVTGVPNHA